MKITAFSVVITTVLLMTASAHAFPFSKKDDAATTTTETTKSADGYQSARFKNLDKNHDGKIREEEFLADQKAEFARLDADKDKSVSPDELDLPPGLSAEQKASIHQQMKQRDEMMAKQDADRKKRMDEDMKRMQAENEARNKQAAAAAAVKTAPVAEPIKETTKEKLAEHAKAPEAAKGAIVEKSLAFTSAVSSAAKAQVPAFSSGATKAMSYTSSATHNAVPVKKY